MDGFKTPGIGVGGIYTLAAPFDTALLPNVTYSCISIRTIADIQASGQDPYATYYKYDTTIIDKSKYDQDVAAGVLIITLQAENGLSVYVPNSYITSFPNQTGIPYKVMGLVIQLAAIPDSYDLTAAKTRVSDVIMTTVGVTAQIDEVQLSATQLLDSTTAATAEAARQANITNNTTDAAKIVALQNQNYALTQQVAALEQALIALKK